MSAVESINNARVQSVAERRMRMPPIPDDFFSLITNEQRIALNQKQQFGWFVKFVRRPLFQPLGGCAIESRWQRVFDAGERWGHQTFL